MKFLSSEALLGLYSWFLISFDWKSLSAPLRQLTNRNTQIMGSCSLICKVAIGDSAHYKFAQMSQYILIVITVCPRPKRTANPSVSNSITSHPRISAPWRSNSYRFHHKSWLRTFCLSKRPPRKNCKPRRKRYASFRPRTRCSHRNTANSKWSSTQSAKASCCRLRCTNRCWGSKRTKKLGT